ncbi:MAG: hypothetical protein JWP15_245 [Alphaproteobacteria bacterium]|nr:hypothetical protein [Alphaproteobacteria bacterium]
MATIGEAASEGSSEPGHIVGVREREQAERREEAGGLRTEIATLGARLDRLEARAT